MKQRYFLDEREIQISENKIFYHEKRFGSSAVNFNIPFEDITDTKISEENNSLIFFGLSIFFYCATIFTFIERGKDLDNYMWIVFLFTATFSLIFFFYKRDKTWKIRLSHGNYIYLYKNIPDEKTVNTFIESVISKRNVYLRNKYLNFDKNSSYQNQLHNLNWLKNIEVISNDELNEKTNELKALFNLDVVVTGFRK